MRTDRDPTLPLRRCAGLALCALALMSAPATQAQATAGLTAAPTVALGRIDSGALAAAEQGLTAYVQRKQQGGAASETAFDLARPADLAQLRVAGGFEVHTIAPGVLVNERGDLHSMAQPSGVWRFFVKAGQRSVGLITVERVEGRWQAVAFGGAGLAREMSDLLGEHGSAGPENLRFIRVFQAKSDLLEVVSPVDMQPRYALLHSAREALKADMQATTGVVPDRAEPRLRATYELMQPLRNAIQRNLGAQP